MAERRTKANLKIAFLNMRGRYHDSMDKWYHINQMMHDEKITILALQETHLDYDQAAGINEVFVDTLHVIASIDLDHCTSKGVALTFNKRILGIQDLSHHEIIPGRALLVSSPWYQQEKINILNIYAPNDPSKNVALWEEIHDKILNLPQPDIILGDFNFVKDPLDRLPAHFDNQNTVETWRALKSHLCLTDGWRSTFPKSLSYTFAQSAHQGGHQSRIDRIYVHEDMSPHCKDWDISPSPIPTDHQMISVRISKQNMPFIGKGRWTLNPSLLHDNVKSGSTLVGGPVKSRRRRTKEESRGLDKRLVWPELVTAWIQRLRAMSVDPLHRFWSRGEDRDRDGDGQEQE